MKLENFTINELYVIFYLGVRNESLTSLKDKVNDSKIRYGKSALKSATIQILLSKLITKKLVCVTANTGKKATYYNITDKGNLVYQLILNNGIYSYFKQREIKERQRQIIITGIILTGLLLVLLVL